LAILCYWNPGGNTCCNNARVWRMTIYPVPKPSKKPKKRKITVTSAKKKAWKAFSEYIRLRDALETTDTKNALICCTCKKLYPAFGKGCAQAGHFIGGRHNVHLFDEKQVHGQCYNCNINLKGNWPAYQEFMRNKYGLEITESIIQNRNTLIQYSIPDLQEIEQKYKDKIKVLNK